MRHAPAKIACAGATVRIGGEIVQGPATNGSLGLSPGRMIHRYQRRIPVSAAIHGSDMNRIMVHAAASLLVLALGSVHASGINSINGGMPNRISMNVTVPKQTQGATFGEKVNSGLQASGRSAAQGASLSIVIECGQVACAFVFPDGSGHRADLQRRRIEALASAQGAALRRGSPGPAMLGGALPGGAVISAAVSSVGNLAGSGGGAAAAAYAATGRASDGGKEGSATASAVPGVIDVVEPLADGDYALTLVVEADTSGAKGAPRTQVRTVSPPRVEITVVFVLAGGAMRARHDTAMNTIRNMK